MGTVRLRSLQYVVQNHFACAIVLRVTGMGAWRLSEFYERGRDHLYVAGFAMFHGQPRGLLPYVRHSCLTQYVAVGQKETANKIFIYFLKLVLVWQYIDGRERYDCSYV